MATKTRERRRSSKKHSGLGGINASGLNMKNATDELLDVALIAGGAIAAAKGAGMLDPIINKSGTKIMGMMAPAVIAAAGVAGAMMGEGMVKSIAKGVAIGGALKVAEKALGKENLLAGTEDETPLMIPGIGSFGQASLPELPQYSEIPEAEVTTTGADPQYYMGQPTEVLSGDDDMVAY